VALPVARLYKRVCVTVQFSYEIEVVAAEAYEQIEVEPRVQKNTGYRPVVI
jgi:hypothetical protein